MLRFDSILGGEDEQISPGKVPISASLYACFVISDGLRCRFFLRGCSHYRVKCLSLWRRPFFCTMEKHKSFYLCPCMAALLAIVLFAWPLAAQDYQFKQMPIVDGMSASLQSVYAENEGFVWMGTRKGLGRFDGYELKMYTHDEDDPYSLPGNKVYQIVEDSLHNIWVLTDGGLTLYDKKTARFLTDLDDKGHTVNATAACRWEGGMLFSSQAALFYYDYRQRVLQKMADYGGWGSFVKEIVPWDKHTLLCLRLWEGLFLLDIRTGKMRPVPIEHSEKITRILLDSRQHLWVTSYNEGLACFDREGRQLATYTTANSSLSHNIILCMVEYEGNIWVGTDGGGINILDPETGQIQLLPYIPGDKNALPDNSIQSLYADVDNLWAGGVKGGLINIRRSFIRSYQDVPLNANNGLSGRAVLAFCRENGSSDIWIGTDGGGINRFNPQTRRFTHYPLTFGEKVTSLCPFNEHELLLTLFSKGVYAFDKRAGSLRKINDIHAIEQQALYGRKSVYVYRDTPSSILVLSSDIFRYFPATHQVKRLTSDTHKDQGVLTAIGKEGPYTYLHDMRSIYSLDERNDSLRTLYSFPAKIALQAVCLDSEGRFYVGTSEGLGIYDPVAQTLISLDKMSEMDVASLLYDDKHHLWIGAENGLYVWLPERKELVALDESDGVQPNGYAEHAVLNASQSGVYMGGINGFVCVDDALLDLGAPDLPILSLGDIISGERSLLSEADGHTSLQVGKEGNVIVKLMTRTSDRFRKRMYRWQIEGTVTQMAVSREPEITLRSLSPGTYRILASCSTKNTTWTPLSHIITFTVPPAWYQTWWFVLICALMIAGLLIYFALHAIHRKEEKVLLALKEHKQQIYEEKVRFLININHELRTPLTLIHAPLSQILHKLSPDDVNYATLKKVLKQSKRMKNLLDMVLSLRKMEVKETKLQIRSYPLNEWLQETVNDFLYEGQERHISLNCETDSAIGEVCFDKDKNVIILTNLLVNAFKHAPDGSVITVRTELVQDANRVRISVIDQGKGLKDVDLDRLFTRFYQGEEAKGGAGIGLSYAQILVEEHHGQIGAYDMVSGGACFWYELPVRQTTETLVLQPQEYLNSIMNPSDDIKQMDKPVTGGVDIRNYVCLFVDDNKDLREMVSEAFQGYFKKLLIASDGQEALELIQREMPDAVVSDLVMPNMDGYELCSHIKENPDWAYIQVVLLTARTDDQSHVDGYKAGADAYMEKPFEPDALLEVLRNRLFLREQLKSRYAAHPAPVSDKPVNSADDAFLYKVNKLIEQHLDDEALDVTFLGKQVGTSRASFYNRIKSLTGMGPNNYINKLRMERAAEMLRQTELSMTEIAERTGFSSSRYFSTMFKKYMGVTPTQYKNEASREQ